MAKKTTKRVIHGKAGSPLPAARPNAIRGAHGVTRPTWGDPGKDGVNGAFAREELT